MSKPAPIAHSRTQAHASALLDAACAVVAAEGLARLSLRPLAHAMGVSVAVLTHRHGARGEVIAAICAAAREADAAAMAEWRAVLDAGMEGEPAADLAEAILDDQAKRLRGLSLLFVELLHAAGADAALRAPLAAWSAQRRAFWDEFAARTSLAPALVDCGWWNGYMLAELAYGLVLDANPWYRLLRRLCLRRLFAGGTASAANSADMRMFALLQERLRHTPALAEAAEGWPALAARACGIQLAERGVGALTHRGIAQRVGIAHTTLSYRFPAQRDLVLAGLASIVAHIRRAVAADSLEQVERKRNEDEGQRLDLARASLAVAIAATRMPELAPYAADMRSRRGDNLAKVLQKYLPQAAGIDALCTQVVSMGLTGVINAAAPQDAAESAAAAAFAAAARWLSPQSR